MTTTVRNVIAAAIVIAALAWIDPLFIPLITLGPLVTGVAAGASGAEPRWVAAAWFGGGVLMLISDLVINQEDVAFHAAVAVITSMLALGATWIGCRLHRRRAPA